jgi:hypothetical protein
VLDELIYIYMLYLSYKYQKIWWYFAGMWMFKGTVVGLIVRESSSLFWNWQYVLTKGLCLHSNWVVLVTSRWYMLTNNNYFKVKVNKLFNNKDHFTVLFHEQICVNNITQFLFRSISHWNRCSVCIMKYIFVCPST